MKEKFRVFVPQKDEAVANLSGEHWNISAIALEAFTDENDTIVRRNEYQLFRGNLKGEIEGNIFLFENDLTNEGIFIFADCPDYERAKLSVRDNAAYMDAGTNTIALGYCKKGECEKALRSAYREIRGEKLILSMSNTWGDRNGYSRVCEEFVLKEIDEAYNLGVDIVQIDDGWQQGNTDDPARRDEKGRRVFADDFWIVSKERFPRGIEYVSEYAKKKGVRLGLWFAPESKNGFQEMERDIAILKNAYDNWGVRFFKLDMYWIESDGDRDRFLEMLKEIHSFGPDVSVQLDVTRDYRINYLCGKQYGTVFVENRYTKWANYYPHRTLKNLWSICRYVPAYKFQFELVNNGLNGECYDAEDEFAPKNYDIDYLFASVMLSNPLFWMEMQFLSVDDKNKLKRIISVWKKHREAFSSSDICPIGERPSGRSYTGFHIKGEDKEYLLLFREGLEKTEAEMLIETDKRKACLLASNGKGKAKIKNGKLKINLQNKRTYALFMLK